MTMTTIMAITIATSTSLPFLSSPLFSRLFITDASRTCSRHWQPIALRNSTSRPTLHVSIPLIPPMLVVVVVVVVVAAAAAAQNAMK